MVLRKSDCAALRPGEWQKNTYVGSERLRGIPFRRYQDVYKRQVFMRYVREQYKPVEISAAIIIGGCAVFNLAFLIYGIASDSLNTYFEPFRHTEFIVATAYLGVGCILLSAQLMSYLLSKMAAVKATIFGNVSTAISIVAGVVVLGEPLRAYHIICTVLIIVGVIGLSLSGDKKSGKEEKKARNREEEHEISISDGK